MFQNISGSHQQAHSPESAMPDATIMAKERQVKAVCQARNGFLIGELVQDIARFREPFAVARNGFLLIGLVIHNTIKLTG